MEGVFAGLDTPNGDSRSSSKVSGVLAAVSSRSITSTSAGSDSRNSERGGEIRNVGAAPSRNTTLTATEVKRFNRSSPSK